MSVSKRLSPGTATGLATGLGSPRISPLFVILPTALALLAAVVATINTPSTILAPVAAAWMIAWFVLSLLFGVLSRRHFAPGVMGGMLFLLMGWRIAGPLGLDLVSWPAAIAAVFYLLRFVDAVIADLARGQAAWLTLAQWQLTFIRLYIAFDMIPHFTEKLFAGPVPFHEDAMILARYGMSPPELFVLAGGLCELAVAIGLGLGILTRVAGIGAAIYFLVTSMIGNHFGRGFIWNLNGGGWEYPLLMLCLFLSFAFTGGGRFSIDYLAAGCKRLPRFVSLLGIDTALLAERQAAASPGQSRQR